MLLPKNSVPFEGIYSSKLGKMCLAKGPQRSDAGEARTRGPSVSSQALYMYHCSPIRTQYETCVNYTEHVLFTQVSDYVYLKRVLKQLRKVRFVCVEASSPIQNFFSHGKISCLLGGGGTLREILVRVYGPVL